MKVTASQAVKTTAKLQTIGKQLSLIGTNLLSGKYASVQDLKRVRASVVNASNIARRANDQILDGVSSKEDLQDIISCGDSETMDKAIESTLEVATRAAMLCKAIDGEIESLEPAEAAEDDEEVTDEILDDEGADVVENEAADEDVEVSDEIGDDVADDVDVQAKKCKATEDDNVDVTDDVEDDTDDVEDDTDDEVIDSEASEDDDELDTDEVEEVEAPIVAKKKAAVATKKASVVKKSASFKGGISWTMPSLPEAKRR